MTLAGCAGRTPIPVSQHQTGDESLSCQQIFAEVEENKTKILQLVPKANKTSKNLALAAAGIIVFPAWFFMDFSDAERVEIEAFHQRNKWLQTLAVKKQCVETPSASPTTN